MEDTFPGLIPQDAHVVSHTEVLKLRIETPDRLPLGSVVSWQGHFYRVDRVDIEPDNAGKILTLTRSIRRSSTNEA